MGMVRVVGPVLGPVSNPLPGVSVPTNPAVPLALAVSDTQKLENVRAVVKPVKTLGSPTNWWLLVSPLLQVPLTMAPNSLISLPRSPVPMTWLTHLRKLFLIERSYLATLVLARPKQKPLACLILLKLAQATGL